MADHSYGSQIGGGFGASTDAYKADPTIENYVNLRRADPEAEIEVAVIGGFESMFYMRDEFARCGLDPELLGGVLDADPHAIGEISLQILEQIIAGRLLEAAGATHLASRGQAIPDKLVDWVITCALDSLSWNDDLQIPRDLIVLIRERLGGAIPQYEVEGRTRAAKSNAAIVAGQLMAQGVTPTLNVLGEHFGVSPSTVMRWFEPGELQREAKVWSQRFDEKGQLRPALGTRRDVAPNS